MMFWLKTCPKCHGDLYSENDVYGPYIACLQCSHYLTEAEEAQLMLHSGRHSIRNDYLVPKYEAAV